MNCHTVLAGALFVLCLASFLTMFIGLLLARRGPKQPLGNKNVALAWKGGSTTYITKWHRRFIYGGFIAFGVLVIVGGAYDRAHPTRRSADGRCLGPATTPQK